MTLGQENNEKIDWSDILEHIRSRARECGLEALDEQVSEGDLLAEVSRRDVIRYLEAMLCQLESVLALYSRALTMMQSSVGLKDSEKILSIEVHIEARDRLYAEVEDVSLQDSTELRELLVAITNLQNYLVKEEFSS